MIEQESTLIWLSRQGFRVIRTKSSYWYDLGPRVFQAFPYYRLIAPTDEEIKSFFKQSKAIAVRYSTSLDQPEGKLSYHVVYDQENYELANLPKKARHDVAHGLQYAAYEPISLGLLAQEGWKLQQDTLARQDRKKADERRFWEVLCLSAEGLLAFEAWGALHEGKLVAALLACTIEDTVNILYQLSMTQHLKFGINNALTYVFTKEVLHRPGIRCVFYGLHSLDAPQSVDEFKFRMGYSAKPVRQRVVFNPLITPLIRPWSHKLIRTLLNVFRANYQIAKTEGLVRFYLQGKYPLSEQVWPEILLEQKNSILAQEK